MIKVSMGVCLAAAGAGGEMAAGDVLDSPLGMDPEPSMGLACHKHPQVREGTLAAGVRKQALPRAGYAAGVCVATGTHSTCVMRSMCKPLHAQMELVMHVCFHKDGAPALA